MFEESKIKLAAKESHAEDEFEFAKDLYMCATSEEAIERIVPIEGSGDTSFGEVSIKILKREGFPKRIGFVRNGILITDSLEFFGDQFRRFPNYQDFIAIVQPSAEAGSALLKKLENPSHDAFSAERISDDGKRAEAIAVMENLVRTIRNVVRDEARPKPTDTESLNELAEFFTAPSEGDNEGDGELNPLMLKYSLGRGKPTPTTSSGKGNGSRGGSGTKKDKKKKTIGGKANPGPGGGSGSSGSSNEIVLEDARNIAINKSSRVVYFSSSQTNRASLEILSSGITSSDTIALIDCDVGEIKNGKWILDLNEAVRLKATLTFGEEFDGPIEIVATPIEGVKNEN